MLASVCSQAMLQADGVAMCSPICVRWECCAALLLIHAFFTLSNIQMLAVVTSVMKMCTVWCGAVSLKAQGPAVISRHCHLALALLVCCSWELVTACLHHICWQMQLKAAIMEPKPDDAWLRSVQGA